MRASLKVAVQDDHNATVQELHLVRAAGKLCQGALVMGKLLIIVSKNEMPQGGKSKVGWCATWIVGLQFLFEFAFFGFEFGDGGLLTSEDFNGQVV